MGRKEKRSFQNTVTSGLRSHGEQFMAMFEDSDEHKRKKTSQNAPSDSSSEDGEESGSDTIPDVILKTNSSSEEDQGLESSQDEESDSLACLSALEPQKRLQNEESTVVNPVIPECSRRERKNFMSGKISKVYRIAPVRSASSETQFNDDDDKTLRQFFNRTSREVQQLGSKGMSKKDTLQWKQSQWEKLGGKRAKLHRMPKSVGMAMFKGKVAKERAARNAEEVRGAVLSEALHVLKRQKVKKKEFLSKKNGGILQKTLSRGNWK